VHFVIHIAECDRDKTVADTWLSKPVTKADADYLRDKVIPVMQEMSDEDYLFGPAGFLCTLAASSYILDEDAIYWCIRWEPGIVVLKFSAREPIQWAALRRLGPEVGDREPSDEEWDDWNDENEDYQYNLVFDGFDAAIDPQQREGCSPASVDLMAKWEAAIHHADELQSRAVEITSSKEGSEQYQARVKLSAAWNGSIVMG
jgi:hypothetical protein